MSKSWTVTILEGDNDDAILPFPEEMMIELDWREGDVLDFDMQDDCIIIKNISAEERENEQNSSN
jgi:bifunctional DNA-binding transcriptional regulator/antitoxin component of YhaV-PrlF toxin-antitoxin module